MLRFLIAFCLLFSTAYAQQNDLDFLIEKIKVNYPGFSEKTTESKFDIFVKNAIHENGADTFKMMATIVDYFSDRHLDLFRYRDTVDAKECKKDLVKVKAHLASKRKLEKYEGYWISEARHSIIAIVRESKENYKGYVIECRDSNMLIPGMLYYDFGARKNNGKYFTKSVLSRSRDAFYAWTEFRSNSIFTMGPYNKWHKLGSYSAPLLATLPARTETASAKQLNQSTLLITIPASTAQNGKLVDSLVKANTSTNIKNLIVDIRSNTGGTVRAYEPLYPLLYTQPIVKTNSWLYCTMDDAQNRENDLKDYTARGGNDSAYIKYWEWVIKSERDSIGKFMAFPGDTFRQASVLPYPEKIGIIINFGCQSAAEMFLLNALQSSKVTLFGEHTMGAVDYYDFYPVNLPSGKYKLYIATAKRKIPAGGTKLDGKGIQPHVKINDSEPDWVDFVKRYYDQR